jgi:hypothetical protein
MKTTSALLIVALVATLSVPVLARSMKPASTQAKSAAAPTVGESPVAAEALRGFRWR